MQAMIDPPIPEFPEPSDHRYRVKVLRAGTFRLDGGGMFGLIPKSMWSSWTDADPENRITLGANCLLLEDGQRRVLVETGYGGKWSPKERAIYALAERTVLDALSEVGVEPSEIDDVIVTHLHFDHAAGLTVLNDRNEAIPAFPRARVHVQRREWDDARANRSTMTRTYLASHLEPIAHQVVLHEGPAQVLPGVAVTPFVGHTWGQQGVFVRDESGALTVFPADLLPTINHVHLAASMAYDMLPYENMRTKRAFLARAADQGWSIVLDHEPGTPTVRATCDPRDPTRWRLMPVS